MSEAGFRERRIRDVQMLLREAGAGAPLAERIALRRGRARRRLSVLRRY